MACLVSLNPTFLKAEEKVPVLEIAEDEKPEAEDYESSSGYFFIFIVDRSGSMDGSNIEITRKAL